MTISLITPTADRPVAFGLCERWMARQTVHPDEWIVADGGQTPAVCTQGQRHLHQPCPPGFGNFLNNVRHGVEAATGDLLIFIEDDDWYAPPHLESLSRQVSPDIQAVGDDLQQYYHLGHRVWRTFNNKGASLCQTGLTRRAVPCFLKALERARADRSYGVDARFWSSIPPALTSLQRTQTAVGMKGLPGQAGLGIGHRPNLGPPWHRDDSAYSALRKWVGADVEVYRSLSHAS